MFQDLYFLNFYTCILKSDKTQLPEDESASDTKLPLSVEDLSKIDLIDFCKGGIIDKAMTSGQLPEQMKGMSMLEMINFINEEVERKGSGQTQPHPKGNGRRRGQIEKSEKMESKVGLSSKTPPKPLRVPFKPDSNGNVFQDAIESKTEQNQAVGLVQPPKPLRSPNIVGKKESIRVADRTEKDFRIEPKVDEAVRNLILADQIPPPLK